MQRIPFKDVPKDAAAVDAWLNKRYPSTLAYTLARLAGHICVGADGNILAAVIRIAASAFARLWICSSRWQRKDELLEQFYKTGSFVSKKT